MRVSEQTWPALSAAGLRGPSRPCLGSALPHASNLRPPGGPQAGLAGAREGRPSCHSEGSGQTGCWASTFTARRPRHGSRALLTLAPHTLRRRVACYPGSTGTAVREPVQKPPWNVLNCAAVGLLEAPETTGRGVRPPREQLEQNRGGPADRERVSRATRAPLAVLVALQSPPVDADVSQGKQNCRGLSRGDQGDGGHSGLAL